MSKKILVSLIAALVLIGLVHYKENDSWKLKMDECNGVFATEFARWKLEHAKEYSSPAEQRYRFQIFCQNLNEIKNHNAAYEEEYSMGLNYFSDLTSEEFRAKFAKRTTHIPKFDDSSQLNMTQNLGSMVIPEFVDWSKTPVISRVSNMKECGACYAFAAIEAVEASYYLTYKRSLVLSVENIIDCTSEAPYTNSGCDGGCVFMSLKYIKEQGVAANETYPYTAGDSGSSSYCQSKINRPYKIQNYYPIPRGRSDLLKNLVANKPVAVSIDVTAMQHYKAGIYSGKDCNHSQGNGFMLVVGYGFENTGKGLNRYWILKNHMGTSWGVGGFMKLYREEGQVAGKCGITESGVYVDI